MENQKLFKYIADNYNRILIDDEIEDLKHFIKNNTETSLFIYYGKKKGGWFTVSYLSNWEYVITTHHPDNLPSLIGETAKKFKNLILKDIVIKPLVYRMLPQLNRP